MSGTLLADYKEDGLWVKTRGTGSLKKRTKAYSLFSSIKRRLKVQSAYFDCIVSENFSNFQFFATWCNSQIGYGTDGYQLDKDILSSQKIYSELTCVFVPRDVNAAVMLQKSKRGKLPIGVYFDSNSGKYKSQCGDGVSQNHLGLFLNVEDAFMAYKTAKERHFKVLAEKYKDKIDVRVYDKLMALTVNIED